MHIDVLVYRLFLKFQGILTEKIERKFRINQDNSVSDLQRNKNQFLFYFLHELLNGV